mgnify:CR=1 FL=1
MSGLTCIGIEIAFKLIQKHPTLKARLFFLVDSHMAYTTSIDTQLHATGAQGETQEIGLTGYILNSQGCSTTTYTLVPGQERDVLVNILPLTGLLNLKYYAIKATAPINVAISKDILIPPVYNQPTGLFHLWVGTALGSLISALKIQAPLNNITPGAIDVSVILAFN